MYIGHPKFSVTKVSGSGQNRGMARITPEAAEAFMLNAGYKPLEPYKTSHGKWKCTHLACGEIVFPSYHGIHQGQGGCRPCGRKVGADKKRLSESKTVQIMVKANLQPLEPYKDVKTPWKSRCLLCDRVVQPRFSAVKAGQSGCGFCSGNFVDVSSALNEMKLANLLPLVEYTKSHDEWKCKCLLCGRVVFPTYNSIQQGNGGCKYCSGKFVDVVEAKKLMVSKGLNPLEPFKKVNSRWKCKCLICGKIVTPTYNSIKQGNGGCKYCAGLVIEPKKAVAFMKSFKLKPLVPFKSSHTKWKCKCLVCGQIVYPNFSNIYSGHNGCRYCAPAGFNMLSDSYIYLISHPKLYAHKIGIGNVKKNMDRLGRFNSRGWETHKVWKFKTGKEAIDIETLIFKFIRSELKLPIYLSYDQMKSTGGHAETVGADSITLLELEKIVNKVIRGYRNNQ